MEKQMKNTLKKQQNIHETIYRSVLASNKTQVSNKRPPEKRTPQGKAKRVRFKQKFPIRCWNI